MCLFRWFRCFEDGREECVQDVDLNSRFYSISWEDAGASMKVEITPVRKDGEQGEVLLLSTAIIQASIVQFCTIPYPI